MPNTPIYGFPFEVPSDQPGETLHGGVPPSSDILAEEVEEELDRVENSVVAGIDARLIAVEAAIVGVRWRGINEGTQTGAGDFTITVPAGYERLKLTLVGDLSGQGQVNLRINGSSATDYSWGFIAYDSAGAQDFAQSNFSSTAWKLAEWSSVESNTIIVDIMPSDGTMNPSYQSSATQIATGDTTMRTQRAWGKFAGDVAITSLTVQDNTTDFATIQWWLEGYLI